MFKFMRGMLAVLVLPVLFAACPSAKAAEPPKPTVTTIAAVAGTASATFTCNGPASCVLSDIKDNASGAIVLTARTLSPGGAGSTAVASMACPALGGPLTWSGTVTGRTPGMTDSSPSAVSTSGTCPLAVSPGASMVVTPITIGP